MFRRDYVTRLIVVLVLCELVVVLGLRELVSVCLMTRLRPVLGVQALSKYHSGNVVGRL